MMVRPDTLSFSLDVRDLGGDVPYALGHARQEACADARRRGDSATETLLLLEHAPVFTLGRNANPDHILLGEAERKACGIAIEHTARGGDVTYHGPGQLVGYPVFRIGKDPRGIVPYVAAVEEALLRTAAFFGVTGARDRRNRGVWVGNAKLAAIGVRCSGGVTTHGFALNVSTDLDAYHGIVPCGLRDAEVTSLAALLPNVPDMALVKRAVVDAFAAVFGFSEVSRYAPETPAR